jgi:hypothetical protein
MKTPSHLEKIRPAESANALLALYDERFLWCAYKTIMGRTPDETALRTYLPLLRNGEDRWAIVQDLAASEEGIRYAARGGTPFPVPQPKALEKIFRRLGRILFRRLGWISGPRRYLRLENRMWQGFEQVFIHLNGGAYGQDALRDAPDGLNAQISDLKRLADLPPAAQSIYYRLRARMALRKGQRD